MVGLNEIVDDGGIGEFPATEQKEVRCEADAAYKQCQCAEFHVELGAGDPHRL
jgi:hypothetical protein